MYKILTVVLWITLALASLLFLVNIGTALKVYGEVARDHSALNYIAIFIGSFLGVFWIPGIVWVIRYFVGKNINNE